MAEPWYPRTVLFVSDAEAAYRHYIDVLGFEHEWRHEESGSLLVCEVGRDGVQIILQRDPEKAGKGRVFINPNRGESERATSEMKARGADIRTGIWGMPVIMVHDPDGNQLFFNDDALVKADAS
jgi:catechol 2,3-dioxygenase-like lactoylglutathione lyase family enzyme